MPVSRSLIMGCLYRYKDRTGGRHSEPEQPAHCELHLIPFNISFEGFDVLGFVFFQFYF